MYSSTRSAAIGSPTRCARSRHKDASSCSGSWAARFQPSASIGCFSNNVSVVGAAWGEFALAHPGYVQEQWTELTPLIASGALKPPIGHALPLEQAGEALALMEERNAVGKVVLTLR